MGVRELLQSKRQEILRMAAKHGARNVRVFGSVARGDDSERSDVDFLVEMTQEPPKPFVSARCTYSLPSTRRKWRTRGTLDFPPDLSPFRLSHDLQPIKR